MPVITKKTSIKEELLDLLLKLKQPNLSHPSQLAIVDRIFPIIKQYDEKDPTVVFTELEIPFTSETFTIDDDDPDGRVGTYIRIELPKDMIPDDYKTEDEDIDNIVEMRICDIEDVKLEVPDEVIEVDSKDMEKPILSGPATWDVPAKDD